MIKHGIIGVINGRFHVKFIGFQLNISPILKTCYTMLTNENELSPVPHPIKNFFYREFTNKK